MDASTMLLALGGVASAVAFIIRQIRIGLRDRGDRKFLQRVYDQDRRADVLTTLQNLRRPELGSTKPASDDGQAEGNNTEPPLQLPGAETN